MKKLNRVLIVGRVNIGKSTLFNRLSSTVKSIVYDEEGVTRDYIKDVVAWKGQEFELVDTAGIRFKKVADPLLEAARVKAVSLIDTAQLILFVVDGAAGLLPEDVDIAQALRKSGKKIVLVINKMDVKVARDHVPEFAQFGFSSTVEVSAQHGKNIADLLDMIVETLAQATNNAVEQKLAFSVTLLGKPNVGKSTLLNALIQEERALVSAIPGTTREALHERIQFNKENIELIDTPGVRRPRSIEEELEGLMVKSSLNAVRNTDIVLLLVDMAAGKMSDQELKLAYYAFEHQKKALIILFNKEDMADEQIRKELAHDKKQYHQLFDRVVTMEISATTGKNVGKIMPAIHELWQRHTQEFSREELTVLFKRALIKTPLYRAKVPLSLERAQQIKSAPIIILLFTKQTKLFNENHLGFFDNVLRAAYDLRGVPLKLMVRQA